MRRLAVFCLAVVMTTAAQPALAADAAQIGCVEAKLGVAPMARIGDRVIAAVDAGTSLDAALDLDREAVIAARNTCRTANAWSNDASDIAMSYMRARAALLGARVAMARDGLDAVRAETAFRALGEADRRSLTNGKGATRAVSDAARATAGKGASVATLKHVTILFSALSAIEFYPADFAAA